MCDYLTYKVDDLREAIMDNAEEILQSLEEFTKMKPKEIPKELEEYLSYVAKTGDPVYQWHSVKNLFHEKLLNVITEFYETSPTIDLPPCPNVDPFNYERMKTSLLERLDTFSSAPFTVQRICELLTNPRKQYNRVDKFMRAIEKNILVVSTREPGVGKRTDEPEAVLNGIPDKVNESEDRVPGLVAAENSTNIFNNTSLPVENNLNTCVVQEEVEISNTASSTTSEKAWVEEDTETKPEINVETVPEPKEIPETSSELVSTTSDEDKTEDVKVEELVTMENNLISSTPDSPEPTIVVETTEESTNDEEIKPSSEVTIQDEEETNEEMMENKEEPPEEVDDTNKTEEVSNALESNTLEDVQVDQLSPEITPPDSSDDSFNPVEETTILEPTEISSSEVLVSHPEEEEDEEEEREEGVESSEAVEKAQEVEEEVVESSEAVEKVQEEETVTEKLETVESSESTQDVPGTSGECVYIEEVSETKVDVETRVEGGEEEEEESNEVESSTTAESVEEVCDQERREGSIIHVTPSAPVSNVVIEDICVDQSSVEEEAMDVDETSNQQMVTSEGEMESGEPMDQSEQAQS